MGSDWKHANPPGPNFVPAYQASGIPYVTSSNGDEIGTTSKVIKFPSVTRFFQLTNTSAHPLRVGFTKRGVEGTGAVSGSTVGKENDPVHKNYFVISGSAGNSPTSLRLELRCKELWLRRDGATNSGFSLIAGLTGIRPSDFPVLTGSNGFRGVG